MNVKLKVLRKVLEEAIANIDAINAKHNEDAFNLYKYSRDSKDELSSEIGELRTELAVLKATRPYQDALIQCDIRRVAEHADFNLWRRTCRMISGEVVLPNTPVAINAQYHDYIRLYSEWFRNINKNELDNKIIESAITFYFKDEDSGSTKTWNYFKTAN